MATILSIDFSAYSSGDTLPSIDSDFVNTTSDGDAADLKVSGGGELYGSNGADRAHYATAPGSADFAVEADFSIVATGGISGLILRGATTRDYYRLALSSGTVSWIKMISGSTTTLGSGYSVSDTVSAVYTIRGEVEGDQLRTYVDGVLRETITDTSITTGSFGIYLNSTKVRLQNFLVETLASDVTAPALSSPTGTETSDTTATGTVSTDEGNGTLDAVVTTSATTPTAVQIQAGQDHAGAAAAASDLNNTVTTTGVQNVSFTGLTASTVYYVHYVHEDAAANVSTAVSSASFTTDAAADVTAPTLTSPSGTATGQTTADLSVSTDEGNGTLYWVVTTSATGPSVAQVQAGQDHTGAAAADSGDQAVSGTGAQTPSATGLTAATTYYAHFQHQDAATNDSTVSTSASFETDALAGTVTVTDPLKNNTGTLLASESGVKASVLDATTLESVYEVTGLTTNGSGVLSAITNAAITASSSYHVVIKLADDSVGITGPITAA